MLAARHARCCGTPSASIVLAAPGGFPSGGSRADRHRLALACPYPQGPGWADVRPSGRVPGISPGWPGARASAAGLEVLVVLAAASSAAMTAAGAATRKSRIPSGPDTTGAAAAVILASP
jgi:hypothetical protein